ncbi:MAG: RNA chaperone Hfq [Armatimonadetes bacterium]|jgi:host factor-I protein|nr:RNA chaperone Hfq [Armatimonadota bacterium]
MSRMGINIQETFLNLCRREQTRCIVYLVNGVQLRGVITGFDNFTILLEDENRQQIVYKHAVTTVQPMRRLPDVFTSDEEGAAPRSAEPLETALERE